MGFVLYGRFISRWFRSSRRTITVLTCMKAPETGSHASSLLNPKPSTNNPLSANDELSIKPNQKPTQGPGEVKSSTQSISKAMTSYLERAEAHHKFMKEQEEEFVFGRRHLANMMGKDPETFTRQDIEEAIRYLFPAAISTPLAKPMMKPPNEIHPKSKSAQFDTSGRPYHPFFYTAKPVFFNIVYEAVCKMNALDAMSSSPSDVQVSGDVTFAGTTWISQEELEQLTLEPLSETLYSQWTVCMDRLVQHERHDREKEFVMSYRKPLSAQTIQKSFPPVFLESDGRQRVRVDLCLKKKAEGNVTVTMPGSGKISINGEGLEYFSLMRAREAFIYPLQLVNWLGTVDIVAETKGSGIMAQAASLRWGVAMGISALGADAETLRLAGLLTRDRRRKERRRQGCEGARAAWPWKAR